MTTALAQKEWFKILCYFVAVALLGALLAPALFSLGKFFATWAEHSGMDSWPLVGSVAESAERAEFTRYFNRAVLIAALLGIWPLARWLKLKRGHILKLQPNPRKFSDLSAGFLLAGGILLLMGWLLLARDIFILNPNTSWNDVILVPITAAIGVAIIEELFFRGLLTGVISNSISPTATLWFVAILFTIVHFLQPPSGMHIPDDSVNALSGFLLAGIILGSLGNLTSLAAEFATLLAVGLILGWTRLRTQSLWMAIGLHAGWVFALKAFSAITRRDSDPSDTLPWIGHDLKTGLYPLLFLLLTAALVGTWLHRRRKFINNSLA